MFTPVVHLENPVNFSDWKNRKKTNFYVKLTEFIYNRKSGRVWHHDVLLWYKEILPSDLNNFVKLGRALFLTNYSLPQVGFPCLTTKHMKDTLNPCLALVQPRKTCPDISEKLLTGLKESNQTKHRSLLSICCQAQNVGQK